MSQAIGSNGAGSGAATDGPGVDSGSGSDAGSPDGGDDGPRNPLFEFYREYIGEPEAETDVYLGFGLFFGGIALGVVALALFLWAGAYETRSAAFLLRSEPAYALGMLSLPAALLGVVVLLPVDRRALYASLGGTAVVAGAVVFFVAVAYPDNWNGFGADYTVEVVAAYALGLTAVVASTGAALVAHQIERAKPADIDIEELERRREGDADDEGETWTEEEIERDIEEAMADTDISWGGIDSDDASTVELNTDIGGDVAGVNLDPDTDRSEGVDAQVQGLRELKGSGEKKTTTAQDSTVDDQTAALNELKRKKEKGETPDPDLDDDDEGVVDRVRGLFS